MRNPLNQMMINKLKQNQAYWLLKRIWDYIEKDPYAKSDELKKENLNKRKWHIFDMLLDYILLWCDRMDWLDKDVVNLCDNYLVSNSQYREYFINYLVDLDSVEFLKWNRNFKDWEYDILIDRLELVDRPLSVLVVCVRVYINELIQHHDKVFVADDFNSVIEWCKWKNLKF